MYAAYSTAYIYSISGSYYVNGKIVVVMNGEQGSFSISGSHVHTLYTYVKMGQLCW